jgi:hypothetical protein
MPRSWLSFRPSSIPIVAVHVAGLQYFAMIDSGADASMITPDLSILLGLPKKGQQLIRSVYGQLQTKNVVELPVIDVGELELPPCKASISNLSVLRFGIDLLLGVNAFKNHRVYTDYKEGRVYIFPPS